MEISEKILEENTTDPLMESIVLKEKTITEIAQILGVKTISRQLKIVPIAHYTERVTKSIRYITLTQKWAEQLIKLIEADQPKAKEQKPAKTVSNTLENTEERISFTQFEKLIKATYKNYRAKGMWDYLVKHRVDLFFLGWVSYMLKKEHIEEALEIIAKRCEIIAEKGARNAPTKKTGTVSEELATV